MDRGQVVDRRRHILHIYLDETQFDLPGVGRILGVGALATNEPVGHELIEEALDALRLDPDRNPSSPSFRDQVEKWDRATLDNGYFHASFDSMNVNDAKLIAARDLSDDSKAKCMTAELRNAMNTFQGSAFQNAGLQYKVGTLIAVSMYWASVPTGKADVMQKSLINSYDDESAGTPGFKQFLSLNIEKPAEFTPEVLTNIIASHIEDLSLRNQFCKQMWDRLDLDSTKFPSADLPACLAAARGTTCPILKQ